MFRFFNCAFLLFLPLSWLLTTTTRRLSLRLTPPVSSPSFPLTSFPPPGLLSFFLSICSAVRRWVDFNELFDERLSLVRRRDWGGRMEEKHHLFFWFPFLGSLPSLLTSLPPSFLYIFMFLNPFLSFLCPHLTFPLLTSPHILHPLLSFPSFHPCLISPCYLTFLYLHFLSLISFNSSLFHIFSFSFPFLLHLLSHQYSFSFFLWSHLLKFTSSSCPNLSFPPFPSSPVRFSLSSYFPSFFITLSYLALPFVTSQQLFFCFSSVFVPHPFSF